MAAAAGSRWAGRRTSWSAGTATYSANPPCRVNPIQPCCEQRCDSPRRHTAQVPHGQNGCTSTASPTSHPSTASPTATMVPAISCPNTRGNCVPKGGVSPRTICRSLPHTPQASTCNNTSFAAASGTGKSTRSVPRSGAYCNARILFRPLCFALATAFIGQKRFGNRHLLHFDGTFLKPERTRVAIQPFDWAGHCVANPTEQDERAV